MNRHLRKAAVATAAITAGLLMTACQSSTADSSSGKSGTGTAAVAEQASDSKNSTDAKDARAAKAAEAAKGSSDAKNSRSSKNSKGVSGSFKNGKVTYLAPGKYIVSVPGRGDQQFLVADDTEVYGAGTICGDAGSEVDAPCTLDQLETATKKAAVNADVEMTDGIATLVTERRAKGVDGTWFGNVSYLAPGTYTVSDLKGTEQQFLVAEDTEIWGYGDICGDTDTGEGGQGGTQCTEAELEAAAKKGFSAEVVISNGIATTIRDDH
ncbi:hypothetical protein [Streptomyces africanus]|uniref:hypothetical protein n=1 Tax=Streptomyces africanus TaxID=231024 RepID=UPI000A3C500D|nr:hypothetical protein [Streptomyces africanus]